MMDIELDRLLRESRRAAAEGHRERREIIAEAASRGLGRSAAKPLLEQIERQFEATYERERAFLAVQAPTCKSPDDAATLEEGFHRQIASLTRGLIAEMVGYARGNASLQESIRGELQRLSADLVSDMSREYAAVRERTEMRAAKGTALVIKEPPVKDFDAFVSHATEDKAEIAEPLARALREAGLRVWFDKFVLEAGDSLRQKIEEGLAKSRFGIVILSPSFFAKGWPQKELNGLLTREVAEGTKVILPVWHKVDAAQVRKYSLILADKVGIPTEPGVGSVAEALLRVVRGSEEEVPDASPPLSVRTDFKLLDAGGGRLHTNEFQISLTATGPRTIERFRVEIEFPAPFLPSPETIPLEIPERATAEYRFFRIGSDVLRDEMPLFPKRSVKLPGIRYVLNDDLYRALEHGTLRGAAVKVRAYWDGGDPIEVTRPMSELNNF